MLVHKRKAQILPEMKRGWSNKAILYYCKVAEQLWGQGTSGLQKLLLLISEGAVYLQRGIKYKEIWGIETKESMKRTPFTWSQNSDHDGDG